MKHHGTLDDLQTIPDVPGAEHAITSDDVFFLEKLPERVLVVGGGYIAVEFAGIFHGLGVEVVQIYRGSLTPEFASLHGTQFLSELNYGRCKFLGLGAPVFRDTDVPEPGTGVFYLATARILPVTVACSVSGGACVTDQDCPAGDARS